ncbi:exported hypothetical protein [uncultured delta proteobacterium]|uniref:Methyl-accepting chemotaxis sensory transducer with Cache sensor n=1 Tax=uncultured delta proteobacterium TaxID=34034 RepID=A0A212K2R2_9DELT|nr:exported hypothetical protein [uncultured delta proteobacterium]
MKLQTKMLLPIMALVVLLCGLSGYLSYRNAAADLQTAIEDNLRGEAEALGRATNSMVKDLFLDAGRIVQRNVILNFYRNASSDMARKAIVNDLRLIEESYPAFDRIHLLDDKGEVIASTDSDNIGKNYADRAYFKEAMKGEIFLSPPFQSRLTDKGIMVAAAPVTLNGRIVGAIYCPVPLEYLYKESVAPVTVGSDGYAYILDRNGLVVAHKNQDFLFNNTLNGMEHYKAMAAAEKDGLRDFVGAAKERVIAYHVKEPQTGLVAVTQAEHADVFEGLARMRNNSLIVAGAGIFLAAIVIMLILRPVLRDLHAGMVFAGKIAAGDLSGTLAVSRKDELGKLGDALRAIPESLQKIVAEYRQLEKNIEVGNLRAAGDASPFSGEFANLINGTNAILGCFVAIVDAIPSPTLMLDKNLTVRYMNGVAQKLAGTDYDGKSCVDLFRLEDYGTERCALTRAASSGQPCENETVVRPGGREMEISYTAIPLFDPQGNLASVLLLMIDLTQIKSTQRTIMDVAAQAMDIANRVAAASEQLSAQVEQVSRGTEIQRDRVNSTATAMEQMNATVLEVAHSAGEASKQAESMRGKASQGAELVDNVIAAVQRVNTVAEELQGNMRELGDQAESIGGVMNVISDIADQTNLLALNAAIEAARAGDAGRGFAVVADEVRKLAEKTMGATTEVGASIKGIQHSAMFNIKRVDDAGKSVAEATGLAGTSGEALKEIVTLAGENSSLIANIATAAEEQSATSEEINHSVEEINRIAGEAATGMNESASAVQELSRMAQELNTLLDRLKAA